MTTAVNPVSESIDLRDRAAEVFAKLGWPTTRIEEWRYTNLAPLQKIAWRTDENPQRIESPASLAGRAALELVFVNGRLVDRSGDLKAGAADDAGIADWERNPMVALNTAHMQDGARIEIPAGTVVDGFIHLLFIGSGDGIWSHPRNVIIAGSNSQVTIVETYAGTGSCGVTARPGAANIFGGSRSPV